MTECIGPFDILDGFGSEYLVIQRRYKSERTLSILF